MLEITILFIVCVGGCWLVFKSIGEAIFGKPKERGITIIDKSVHYHEHKSINIIDGDTKKNVYEISESQKN